MLIKYNGEKPQKKISWRTKDWGEMEFTFNPVCKVTDSDFAKFLLHPDRKGLFSIVESEEGIEASEAKKPEPGYVPLQGLDKEAKKKPKSNRKRLGKQEHEGE